ncbi:MAG: glutamate formiminotransferase / 5-formyltetrahydrofolate cyclo-ligase [Thermoleophilaceae bacterium]|nr:glutamate formiminotransferase / 5-formyltetrahydrofolate cyclo-ligase [Thermoleophilaceae bacterium]
MTGPPLLLAVPNASAGSDRAIIDAIAAAFEPARLLDLHVDRDHGRSVFTLAARQGELARCLVRGAAEATRLIDISAGAGLHPHVGALDVMPVVYTRTQDRGAACAEVLTAAARVGADLGVPVILYGQLASTAGHRERADLRRGGLAHLTARILAGEVKPDFGPARVQPRTGAILATARPPLAAFNLDLDSDDVDLARRIASDLREAGGGLPGVRAIGLFLPARGRAQVSMNVHDPIAVPLVDIVERVRARARVAEAEIVGLVPEAALEGFPADVPIRGAGQGRPTIEDALRSV